MKIKCSQCKKIFQRNPNRIRVKNFCSKKCFENYTTKKFICVVCKKEFSIPNCHIGKYLPKYCSKKCWDKIRCKNTIIKKCVCGKEFKTSTKRELDNRGKFCSSQCYWKSIKPYKYSSKKESLKANRDRSRFGRNREEVLNLYNFKCSNCGSKNDLVIHHIDGTGYKSLGTYKGVNNQLSNLQVLCRTCHTDHHNKEDIV